MDLITTTFGKPGRGKLSDSLDSLRFSYIEIDPRKENFTFSATFEVEDASGADYMSGYGIMVVDTVACPSTKSRHRNSLMVGRFRSLNGQDSAYGLRVVGGYTEIFCPS